MARPIDSDSAETYERILASAKSILSTHGPELFSLRSVARTAGVSLGTLNYYFENRNGLLEACLDEDYRELEDSVQETIDRIRSGAPFFDEVARLTRIYFADARNRKDKIRLRVMDTMERGGLPPHRLDNEVSRMLDRVSLALSGRPDHLPLRMAAHSFQMIIARYALHSDEEIRRITGKDSAEEAWQQAEAHLIETACSLFENALRSESPEDPIDGSP